MATSSFLSLLNAAASPTANSSISPHFSPIHHLEPQQNKVAPGAPKRKRIDTLFQHDHQLVTFDLDGDLNNPFSYLVKKMEEIGLSLEEFNSIQNNDSKTEDELTKECVKWLTEHHRDEEWKCFLNKTFTDKYC